MAALTRGFSSSCSSSSRPRLLLSLGERRILRRPLCVHDGGRLVKLSHSIPQGLVGFGAEATSVCTVDRLVLCRVWSCALVALPPCGGEGPTDGGHT